MRIRPTTVPAGTAFVLRFDVKYLAGLLVSGIEAEIGALRILTRAYFSGDYESASLPIDDSGFLQQGLSHLASADELIAQANRSAALSVLRQFTQFMDDVLAVEELENTSHVLTRAITSPDDQGAYMLDLVKDRSSQIGTRKKLHSPNKYNQLVGDEGRYRDEAAQLFRLRAALEHHRQIAGEDISIRLIALRATTDGRHVEQGQHGALKGGEHFEMNFVDRVLDFAGWVSMCGIGGGVNGVAGRSNQTQNRG